MFFTLNFGDNVFIIDFSKLRDKSCREILAPASQSGSDIIDAATYSAHRCSIRAF